MEEFGKKTYGKDLKIYYPQFYVTPNFYCMFSKHMIYNLKCKAKKKWNVEIR